ncbi:MAG: hypothetical protein QXO30_02440 [Candidatus Caldarchaeum sp.]
MTRIRHAGLTLKDIKKHIEFFQQVLGAELIHVGESRDRRRAYLSRVLRRIQM